MNRKRRSPATLCPRPRRAGWAVGSGGSAGGGCLVQGVFGHWHGHGLTPVTFGLLALVACVGVLGIELLERLVPRGRAALRARRLKRQRLQAAANIERRARALMDELCPQGWRAQITLFGAGDEVPDLRGGEPARVAIDWEELEDSRGRPAVARRVWALTIAGALEAMVADRRTDETLEQIEQGAVADGALWPDL